MNTNNMNLNNGQQQNNNNNGYNSTNIIGRRSLNKKNGPKIQYKVENKINE